MNESENILSSTKSPSIPRSARWRRARRILICIAALATLVAAFYTVENWRGKRAWEKYKRDLEAKGTVLDWNASVPPPVPDEQNFFKAPKMAEWFVKGAQGDLSKRLNTSTFSDFLQRRSTNAV